MGKQKEPGKMVGFRMPAAKYLKLRILALKQNRPLAAVINEAIDSYLRTAGKRKVKP